MQTPSTEKMEERIHHPYSPSSLQSRESCPKYTGHTGPVHEMALTGTLQHNAVDGEIDDPRLPDYRAHAVVECIKFAEERAKLFPGGTVLREQYLPVDDRLIPIVEEVVNTDPDTGLQSPGWVVHMFHGTTAGYLDFAVLSADKTEAEIIDWKFGNNAVEDAETNLQGIGYLLGLHKKFPTLKKVTVRFVMPHLDYMSEHTFTSDQFDSLLLRVRVVVGRAIEAHRNANDFSMATPNSSACMFCGHIGRCPAVTAVALKLGKKYRPLEIPEHITPSTVHDPTDVGTGIRLAAVMATWAEAFRRQATARTIEDIDFVPDGYTLVTSQKRIVKNARALADAAKKFIPAEQHKEVEALFDISIGPLEKLISTAAPRGSKESTVDDFGKAALEAGALELGQPFAFLRQARKQDTGKVAEN